MKISDIDHIFSTLQIPRLHFVIGGSKDDDAWCIFSENESWTVAFFERGQRTSEKTFKTEDQACRYFMIRVVKSDSVFFPPK